MAKKISVGAGGNKVRAKQDAAGIPDSRPFVAPEGERHQAGVDRLLKCHIKGVLVSELDLNPEVLSALDYYATDEGIAEKENHPMAREASGVTLGKDPFAKALDEKRDDVKVRGIELAASRDPLKEVADAHAVPGMHPKFLSARRVQDNGGTGDYEVVKDDNGDPVKVKGMILGHAPDEVIAARQRQQQRRGNDLLKQIGEQYKREGGETAVADQ
jgi:hypothetical protein